VSRWDDAAHTAVDVAKGIGVTVGVGAVMAGSAMPDLTATDYYADHPVQGIVAATSDIAESAAETSKGQDEMTGDLDGVPEAESAEHSPAPEGSTFATAEAADAPTDESGDGDAFAAENDVADTADESDGDAFAAGDLDGTDGELGDDAGDAEGDTGADSDGDADGGSDGGAGGW
jgi:hypothetical protein